ncbi:hypothetical protein ACHHYP_06485 [Achlya hypogyna]|uniref:AAA+ ATPase domain-containing protein n=1 Tax=Achlya hypogyna TaxID=1202772 RepID=A0A1V9YTH6_ACHHY|nr:hypothetical protein ACHHYP_06485 [Achlya hypogyna]
MVLETCDDNLVKALTEHMMTILAKRKRFWLTRLSDVRAGYSSAAVAEAVQQLKKNRLVTFHEPSGSEPYFAKAKLLTPSRILPSCEPSTCQSPSVVTTSFQLASAFSVLEGNGVSMGGFVAIDAHGADPDLLVQLAMGAHVYLVDCRKISLDKVSRHMTKLLQLPGVTTVAYDVHRIAPVLSELLKGPCHNIVDLQLAVELSTSKYDVGVVGMLAHWGRPAHPLPRYLVKSNMLEQLPLRDEARIAAAATVSCLLGAVPFAVDDVGDDWEKLVEASQMRLRNAMASNGARTLCVDKEDGNILVSFEYLATWSPSSIAGSTPLVVHEDLDTILGLLPDDLAEPLRDDAVKCRLQDIVLDLGRQPWAWVGGARFFLAGNDERTVTQENLDEITEAVGGFGSDDRAGLERQLHRVSAVRNRLGEIMGLTIRAGRYIEGNASMIADILAAKNKSVLFLGEPGCGKTTIVREVSRQLAAKYNVCIVDTSNEIAGDGNIPHPCVGLARRMMVPSLDKQAAVMVKVVQNHTPEVMVIDEIGRANEVEAARTCKQRGVRIVASAHGDLRKLLKNKPLSGLVGGTLSVTVGDALAKEKSRGKSGPIRKQQTQRAGEPIFEVVVELRRGEYTTWRLVMDAAAAVDAILEGQMYEAQVRTRTEKAGAFTLSLEQM